MFICCYRYVPTTSTFHFHRELRGSLVLTSDLYYYERSEFLIVGGGKNRPRRGWSGDAQVENELQTANTLIWRKGKIPQHWKDAFTTVLHEKGDETVCVNYRGIALVSRG